MALEQFDENQPRKIPTPNEVFGSKKVPTPSEVFGDDLKKKESTRLGFSVTPLPSQDKFQEGLAMAQSPIASAVKKDTQKDENLAAGIYNTLVGSVKRLAGGAAYAGEVFLGGRPEATITRLASAENTRQKTEQFVEKARSEKASKQYEESMGKYDFTPKPGGGLLSGVDADDFKALAFTAPSQALDMVLGSLTYGSSFVAQSISDAANEINQSDSGKKLNEAQKATYIFTQAAVQAALEKVSLDLILKNTGLGKAAKQKIANEITDEFVKKGIKATAKDIEEAAFKKASTFANQAKRVGIKAVAGVATEGTTEGTQTAAQEGIKLLTNKIVDKDVFNEEDIIANLGKNIINASIGGAAFGSVAGGGVGVFQNTNKAIRDEVAKAGKKYFVNDTEVSEAEFNAATGNKKVVSDITKIQDEISKQVEEGNITPQEAQAANITAQQYAEIAGKIPTTVSPQDKYRIIGGIEQREALNARKQQAYDELTTLDPVFRKEKQDQIDLIQAKIDETNDYLEGIVSGKKPEYKEKRGMYFKVDSEGNETPINKETYDLAKSIREEDDRKAKESVDTAPAVIMPEENVAPEVVEPTRPAVIMPEENVPAETTVISPEQQGKGAAVIMPEANVAPEVAETVVTEEFAPTEVKPEVKSKLESFKTKFAPQPKEVSVSGVTAAQKRVNRQEAAKIAPTDARGFALSWMNQSPDALDWNSIKDLFGGRRARLNVKEVTPEEIAKRDYVAEKEGDEKVGKNGLVKGIDEVVGDIWNNLPEGLEDRITTRDIKDELEALISEYPTRADAARALIQHEGGLKGKSMEEQQLAFEERKGIEEGEEMAPVQLEGGFVPFEEDMDIEGMEEPPFAVQEATTEEVAAMQDIVKDYIDDGTTSLSEIKKAIAKELGYNTKKLRQTIEDAYNEYTTTAEAAVTEVKSGLLGRVGNAFGKMFGKEAQKPFIAKDGKALDAKAKNVAETGGRVSFQATLPNGQNVTAKPVDASIVNGFYSPLELQINQMKQDKMPAKQWLDKLRGEEARWTGLSDWLSQQEGSLTKEEIKNWLQDNQIEINEIVKGKSEGLTKEQNERLKILEKLDAEYPTGAMEDIESGSYDEYLTLLNIRDKSTSKDLIDLQKKSEKLARTAQQRGDQKLADKYWEDSHRYTSRHEVLELSMEGEGGILAPTKFSMYQLEGDSKDYTEILITKPNKEIEGVGRVDYYKSLGYTEDKFSKLNDDEKKRIIDEWREVGKYESLAQKLFNDNYVKLRQSEQGKVREEFKKLDDQREYKKFGHFDEANILVHLRMNTRIDDKKNKILFLEEVQSDWGQEARKLGTDEELPELAKKLKDLGYIIKDNKVYAESDAYIDDKPLLIRKYPNDLVGEARILASRYENTVPSAPFISNTNDWTKLGLKVALKEAVNIGADKISWTTGAQQVERYEDNIRKQVDKIESKRYDAVDRVEIVAYKNGQVVFEGLLPTDNSKVYISGKDVGLEDIVGKDMAQKIKTGDNDQIFEGDSLTIGGSGMKGFYGSPSENNLGIIGNLAKKLFKQEPSIIKLNLVDEGKENSDINRYRRMLSDFNNELDFLGEKEQGVYENERGERYSINKAEVLDNKKAVENKIQSMEKRLKAKKASIQYSIDVTPELKAQVEVGLPLFMANPSGADILGFSFANRMYLNGEKLNPNTIIHEAGHIWTEWVKNNDYNVYAKGMELVEKSPYLQKAKNSKFYQEQAAKLGTEQEKEEYFKHEALAMAIGDKGAQFVVESKKDAFKDWLKTLWNKIKSLTGFKDLTEEQFQNLTFEEFSKMAVKEILGVENDLDKFQAVRSMKKKKDFVKGKVRGEANKRAIDDFEVDDMVKLIKADYDLQTLKNIRDAIQKRSAEEVLPSQPRKTREARGERKRVEPRVEGDEATGEGEDAQPEDVKEGDKKGWNGAITIAANEDRRLLLGLPEYESEKQSFEKWTDEAIRMLKKGYNVDKLLDRMQKGEVPTPVENQIRKIYVAKLKQDYLANPSAELEKKLIKYTQLNDIANSQAGRALRSLADVADPRETLADFVISKMEANNVDELTEKQREQVKKQYEEVKKKEEDVEAKLEINDELNTQLLAENAFKEEKAKRKPYQKTKDYKADRKSIIESIKQKWKDKDKPSDVLMALPFPVPTKKAQQLVAIAPDVSKLMSSYIEEGVDDLKEIVSRIYVDLRNEIDGLSEKDIFDVIAGRYKKEKPLLSQLQFKKAELKKEAELIAKIEDIMAGNMPTSEKAKIEQNQRITQLRNELRDLKKEVGFYDLSKINSLKEKNLEKIKELDEKIQKGDFEKAIRTPSFLENPEFKKKYPKEYDAYLQSVKELTDKKHEFEVSLAKDELKGLTIREKLIKKWWPEFKNTLSAIKATLDNSFIFIQLGPAIWSNPLLLPKVLNEQRKVIFNEGKFRKEIVQIFENKELANLIEVSGLDILDPQTLRETLREEQLGGTDFLERSVEIKGKKYSLGTIIKAPFERIAIAAGNYVRLKLFLESVSHLEAQGKTIETHEKEFKDAARVANEMTSRGELSEEFKTGWLKTLSSLTWAPKMISSTLNLLGIGDAYNKVLGRKGYYASLSPELKKVAIGKMAVAITVPYLAMAALALDDDFEVDYDPRSVTFGQIKQISTGKSWNPYGRFTSVVRYLILMMLGVRYIGDEKIRADFKTETFKFFRGKMTPAYGLGLDLVFREGFDGQPLSFNDVAKDAVTPLALKDLKTYMEDDGTWGLITQGLPAITGIKVGTEKQFNQAKQPLEDVIKKHARTDDTYYSFELKDPNTKEIATKEQFDKFVKERDRLIAEKLTDLYNGYVITDSPNPVPFVSLEANEASKQISTAKTESTKEAKEIVFGKKKTSPAQKLAEAKKQASKRILEMRKMFRR